MPTARASPLSGRKGRQLDLVFVVDCTGSMGAYISAAQRNIRSIVQRLGAAEVAGASATEWMRVGLVQFRDHPPQECSFLLRVSPFSANLDAIQKAVDSMRPRGGGDVPEAVSAGLAAALDMQWREEAVKLAILIGDAPPHGPQDAPRWRRGKRV